VVDGRSLLVGGALSKKFTGQAGFSPEHYRIMVGMIVIIEWSKWYTLPCFIFCFCVFVLFVSC
jgi:hypothetical protein